MRIRRFTESYEPHEMTDYFLDLIEVEGFTYEPSGTLIKLFYSGASKDLGKFMLKYMNMIQRLESAYGIISKSIKMEDTKEVQAIEIKIQLEKLEDFKIEFKLDRLDTRVYSGDITSCALTRNIYYGIIQIRINLSNVSFKKNKNVRLIFSTRLTRPFTNKNCSREIVINPTDPGSQEFSIDTKNVEKILNIIKSGNIKFYDTLQLEQCLLLINDINPDDLSDLTSK